MTATRFFESIHALTPNEYSKTPDVEAVTQPLRILLLVSTYI